MSPSLAADSSMTNNLSSSRGLSLKDLLEKQDFPGANVTVLKKKGELPHVAELVTVPLLQVSRQKRRPSDVVSVKKILRNVKEESSKYSDDEQNNLSAFLGPNLWEKSSGADFKLEYMDLDEFLVENGIPLDPINDSLDSNDKSIASDVSLDSFVQSPDQLNFKVKDEDLNSISSDSTAYKQEDNDLIPEDDDEEDDVDDEEEDDVDIDDDDDEEEEEEEEDDDSNCNSDVFEPPKPGRSKVPGRNSFDPAKRKFSSDELKPQPLVKKSKKIFVPFDRKDDKYWARRKKNNIAAKRSRDARRVKENQIALRANFLESENQNLRENMAKVLKDMSQINKEKDTLKSDNDFLRKQLSKYGCQ